MDQRIVTVASSFGEDTTLRPSLPFKRRVPFEGFGISLQDLLPCFSLESPRYWELGDLQSLNQQVGRTRRTQVVAIGAALIALGYLLRDAADFVANLDGGKVKLCSMTTPNYDAGIATLSLRVFGIRLS